MAFSIHLFWPFVGWVRPSTLLPYKEGGEEDDWRKSQPFSIVHPWGRAAESFALQTPPSIHSLGAPPPRPVKVWGAVGRGRTRGWGGEAGAPGSPRSERRIRRRGYGWDPTPRPRQPPGPTTPPSSASRAPPPPSTSPPPSPATFRPVPCLPSPSKESPPPLPPSSSPPLRLARPPAGHRLLPLLLLRRWTPPTRTTSPRWRARPRRRGAER